MKKSELKKLIREVIEEIIVNEQRSLDSADTDFDYDVDLNIKDASGEYEHPDVSAHVYGFITPSFYDSVVIANEDVVETDSNGNPTGKILFKKGQDISNHLTTASFNNVYKKLEDEFRHFGKG